MTLGAASTPWDNGLVQQFNCLIGPAPYWGGRVSARNTFFGLVENPDFAACPLVTKAECRPHFSSGEGDSHGIDVSILCDLDNGNFAEGIGWVGVSGTFGAYQWIFEPTIPKNSDRKLSLNFRLNFGRR